MKTKKTPRSTPNVKPTTTIVASPPPPPHPPTQQRQILPISNVVYNLVLPSFELPPQQPSQHTSTSSSRYQFRHSIQIQQIQHIQQQQEEEEEENTTGGCGGGSSSNGSSNSNNNSSMLLQTISTGDLIFVDVSSSTGCHNNDDSENDIDLMKHYQKMFVPPPSLSNKKLNWRVGYVLGFVTSYTQSSSPSSSSSTTTTTTTTTTTKQIVEDHRVIVTWLIPYTYLQDHDQKVQQQQQQQPTTTTTSTTTTPSSTTYLDPNADRKIRKDVRPDGMLFRLPSSSSSSTTSTSSSSSMTSNNNTLQLFSLFGPTTISTSQIVFGTVITLIHHTQYDPKKSKLPHPLSSHIVPTIIQPQPSPPQDKPSITTRTMTNATAAASSSSSSSSSSSLLSNCYEYYFHCHFSLPIVQQQQSNSNNNNNKEPIRCIQSDFIPQTMNNNNNNTSTTTIKMILPPKMVHDAWNLLRSSILLLLSSTTTLPPTTSSTTTTITSPTTTKFVTNWFQQIFSISSQSPSLTETRQVMKTIDTLIETMMKPYPSQHYIPESQNKFQYIITTGRNVVPLSLQQPKDPTRMRTKPLRKLDTSTTNVPIQQDPINTKRRKLNPPTNTVTTIESDDDNEEDEDRDTTNNTKKRKTAMTKDVSSIRSDHWRCKPQLKSSPLYIHRMIIKNKRTPSSIVLHFYPHIDLIKSKPGNSTASSTWRIHVGDVIAVAVEDQTSAIIPSSPIYTNTNKNITNLSLSKVKFQKQSPWYPFHRPWCPAQIVAIYEECRPDSATTDTANRTATTDNAKEMSMMMQVRWFYRPHDIPDDIVEALPEMMRCDLFTDDRHPDRRRKNSKSNISSSKATNELLLSGRQFIEVDEDVEDLNVQAALGRVVVTSQANPHWTKMNIYRNELDDVDQLPIQCRYIHHLVDYSGAESLALLPDDQSWTNYSSSTKQLSSGTQPPYHRGLTCPKSYPGRIPILCKAYGGNWDTMISNAATTSTLTQRRNKLVSAGKNDDHDMGVNDDGDDDHTKNQWPADLLSSSLSQPFGLITSHRAKERVLTIVKDAATGSYREFLLSTPAIVVTKRCDPRATAKKSSTDGQQWTVRIGDVVALAYNGARKCAGVDARSSNNGKKRWFPFLGPWRACQVLNIYRDVVADKTGNDQPSGPTLLEVRWFLHKSELQSRVWEWMPPSHSALQQDEVYESDTIDKGLQVDHILGRVALYIGEQTLISNGNVVNVRSDIPEATCRCRYFYYASLGRFQPLFCSEATPSRWFRRIIERGFKLSPMTQNVDNLRQGIELGLDLRLTNEGGIFRNMIINDHVLDLMIEKMFLNPLAERNKMNREYFLSTSILPPWTKMSKPDFVCAESDRQGIRWNVRIGDIVAIQVPGESFTSPTIDSYFPFIVNWKVAQVLAIYRNGASHKADASCDIEIQVRWLYRRSDHEVLEKLTTRESIDVVYSSDDVNEYSYRKVDLLGPVTLFPGSEKDRRSICLASVWKTVVPYFPVIALTYAGHFDPIKQRKAIAPLMLNVVKAGIEVSDHYDEESRNSLLQALRREVLGVARIGIENALPLQQYLKENANPNNIFDIDDDSSCMKDDASLLLSKCKRGHGSTKAWTVLSPFYTNRSSSKEYFSELDVKPPFNNYATDCITDKAQKRIWTVKLGDPVIVHHEMCAGRASYHASADERIKVVSSLNTYFPFTVPWAVAEVVHISRNIDNKSNDLKMEIRWLYRRNEISSKANKDKSVNDLESEEICESDHYDEIEPSNLLAPAHLHDSAQPITIGNRFNGMPLVEFHCNRFWSVHRRSLKPIGEFKGRIERSWLQSKSISGDHLLKTALLGLTIKEESAPSPSVVADVSFNDAFNKVIHKLSLTDASKEAHGNSAALIGREKERKEIYSFLRSSISGTEQGNSCRASLFIAGPPGTGKTACVLSVIADFQREQSVGYGTGFDFIVLNGMEMRDPFEAYVKLWTQLEGESSRCNAETSASRLEAYFTGKFATNDSIESRVTVVLLDEIDYLVTKKQSVLYNFFDWPSRSMETQSNRRLVVIGVSNTLNLPERLHPRVQSRIGSKRIFFKSYSVNETVTILNSKLQQASPHYSVFDPDAILYASKKTAALSGDIRKAFHICRSAAEMILYEAESSNEIVENPIVRIKDVLKVSRESTNAAQPRCVGLCAPFQVLFLVALAALSRTTGREYGGFDVEEITTKMRSIADAFGDPMYLPPPSLPEALNMIARLRDIHLVATVTPRDRSLSFRASLAGSGGPWPLVSMVMDDLAIVMALKETPHYELAQKFLSRSSY